MKSSNKKNQKKAMDRLVIEAPERLCIYDTQTFRDTIYFLNTLDYQVLVEHQCVHLDFSKTMYFSAAAALMLFAKVTRCQCSGPLIFSVNPENVVTASLPIDEKAREQMINNGLWAAIRPGGQKKLDRLWDNWKNPYKSGSNPAAEIKDVIDMLQSRFVKLPNKLIAALQEAYLNIAHHAYLNFKSEVKLPISEFMIGRWWQYAQKNKDGSIGCIVYDMGSGIPSSILSSVLFPGDDCEQIHYAMQSGNSRYDIQGRGMGFDNIKKPIEVNASAEYLLVCSGYGRIFYNKGQESERRLQTLGIQGTLIEWSFGDTEK